MDDVKSKRKNQFEKYRISGFSKRFKFIFVAYNFLAYVNNICSCVLLIRHMYLYEKNKLFKNISYFNIRTMGRQGPRFYRRFRLARISSYILKDPRVKTYYIYVWLSKFYVNMFTSIKVCQFILRVLVFLKVHHGLDDLN